MMALLMARDMLKYFPEDNVAFAENHKDKASICVFQESRSYLLKSFAFQKSYLS